MLQDDVESLCATTELGTFSYNETNGTPEQFCLSYENGVVAAQALLASL